MTRAPSSVAVLVVAGLVGLFTLAGCHGTRSVDAAAAARIFDRVRLDTGGVHGLSGLAVDGRGVLWTVAERGQAMFEIELDGSRVRSIVRHPVDVARGRDLEALAWAADAGTGADPAGRFWVGLETHGTTVYALRLRRDGDGFVPDATVAMTSADVGVRVGDNHGVEGLCAAGDLVLAGIEAVGVDEVGRWAPLIVIDPQTARPTVRRLRLTSPTGKLSALDCWRDADGQLAVVAIERHFAVTRILTFTVDRGGTGPITPRIALDLAPVLRGALNLEGIVRMPDGRVVAVVDNQYGKITGPDELLVFKDPALLSAAAAPSSPDPDPRPAARP